MVKRHMSSPAELQTPLLEEPTLVALATSLAGAVEPPLVCYLQGDLGAGKTTFARALLRGLGYEGRVKSPTYGLLEHYQLEQLDVLHLDLYRIESTDEIGYLGIADLVGDRTLLLVEWPEHGAGALPEPDFVIRFDHAGARRELWLSAPGPRGRQLLDAAREFLNSVSS